MAAEETATADALEVDILFGRLQRLVDWETLIWEIKKFESFQFFFQRMESAVDVG